MRQHDNPLRRISRTVCAVISILTAVGTVWGAYGGLANPDNSVLSSLMCLAFPLWVIADIVILLIDLWLAPRWIAAPILSIILSAPTVADYFPCSTSARGITSLDSIERKRAFTLLTYNITSFRDTEGIYPDEGNRTLRQIIDADADIVCLQEVVKKKIEGHVDSLKITPALRGKIDSIYPHRKLTFDGLAMLSKYPFRAERFQHKPGDAAEMCRFDIDMDGRRLAIFNVHLQSLGFKRDEKKVFRELTDMKASKQDIKDVRYKLLTKFKSANITRADQVRRLLGYMSAAGKNVIVCGDFNDVPASYSYRMLRDSGLHDAFEETAFFPTITHHADHFFFRIDHILYRGGLKAIDISRGDTRSSDHYYLMATFLWDADDEEDGDKADTNRQ
ncbi:MAG: endonuclease/exonuclease/phosphatase family protein [Pseudoflavonifractor sp.]|nr:endonuclease/exonuclease/phosphatase family protein [Pseudoflavonifractor sp.]